MFDIQKLHINQELVKYHVIFFKYFSGAYMTVSSNTAKGLKKSFLENGFTISCIVSEVRYWVCMFSEWGEVYFAKRMSPSRPNLATAHILRLFTINFSPVAVVACHRKNKNCETALKGKERLYWKKSLIERKAYWNKGFIERKALL